MPTSYDTFTSALQDLVVTGVARRYDHIPASISDLPCQWVQMPESDEGLMTFDGSGGFPTLRAQLLIAVEAVAQGTPITNWSATVTIIDALATALRAVAAGTFAKSKPTFRLRMVSATVGDSNYWAVEATVTAYG